MKYNRYLVLTFLTIFIALLFTACQTINKDGENLSDATSDKPDEITMVVWEPEIAYLEKAARIYEGKTGMKVNIQNYFVEPDIFETTIIDSSGSSLTYSFLADPYADTSMYEQQTISALTTGSGADIYDVFFLEFEHLGRNGLLLDMSGWIENEAEFAADKVFRNILLSGKTESGVFAVPIDFDFLRLQAITSDEPLPENKRMTWQEFFAEVSELDYTQEIAYRGTDLDIFMFRFISRASDFIDEAGRNTEVLNSGDMVSLLEECKDWRDQGLCAKYMDSATMTASSSYVGTGGWLKEAEFFCTLPEEYERSSYFFAPMLSDGDTVKVEGETLYPEINIIWRLYGVNAGSLKAETAQDFLRFLLSEEGQDIMVNRNPFEPPNGIVYPINRAAFRGMVEDGLDSIQASDKELELDFPALINEAEETADQVAYIIIEKPYYRTIIREVAKDFFRDEISAEDAAKQMSDKVRLYLMEQG